ncbi:MAG: cytochrome c oxidase subunit II [Chitinophagaceae bacterium]|nr:cytochrome c oxidase subunit II [Oligoflexus sp.]
MNSFYRSILHDIFPREGSQYAADVDAMVLLLTGLCIFVFLGIMATLLVFSIRYRKKNQRTDVPNRSSNTWLEVTWTIGPLIIFVGFFSFTLGSYLKAEIPPDNAREMFVVGKQWMWKFQHEEGPRELNEIHLPMGGPVRLVMISEDVIHSLYLPDFRIKQDVLPGRYTQLWFTPERKGVFTIHCAEFCGTDHSRMDAKVTVMDPLEFDNWLKSVSTNSTLVDRGRILFESHGCVSCHNSDTIDQAPSLADSYGKTVKLDNGDAITIDENYLRESILDPQAKKRAGYRPIMPAYARVFSESEVIALLAFLKSYSSHRLEIDSKREPGESQ